MSGIWQSVVQTLQGGGLNQVTMVIMGTIMALFAGAAFLWAKYPVRWGLALGTAVLIFLIISYRGSLPGSEALDPDLPAAFFPPRLTWWLLALSLTALYLSVHLVGVWVQTRRGVEGEAAGEAPKFPDLEAAWDEIQIRLSHAQYDAGRQKVFLLLTPEEAVATALIDAAGLQLYARAPVDENSPIHAYATSDGLFLSCGGACAWGRGEEGTERLTELCRKVLAMDPEQPVLRGVAVVYPMEDAATPEMLQTVGALRNDLQTIRAELNVRCPTLAVFCLRDTSGGFGEFVRRVPGNVRLRRCGFSIPPTQKFDRAAALKGLGWMVQWFSTWSIKLMTDDYPETEGNSRLVSMNAQLWRDLPALAHLLDASFSTHARAEPILVRGCYFVAGGPEAERRGFAAGLINGRASKMIGDAVYTAWSDGAGAIDRRYRLAAIGLALATALLALPIWLWGIVGRLDEAEVTHAVPAGPWLAWGCLGLLAATWAVGIWMFGSLRERTGQASAPAEAGHAAARRS